MGDAKPGQFRATGSAVLNPQKRVSSVSCLVVFTKTNSLQLGLERVVHE
jgi:hypothetical protein